MSSFPNISLIIERIIGFVYYDQLINFSQISKLFKAICKDSFARLELHQREDLRMITFSKEQIRYDFHGHCKKGYLLMAQYEADKYNITADTIDKYENNEAILSACSKGYLDLIKWLVNRFQLTRDDFVGRYYGFGASCNGFGAACYGGHLLVAQWLTDKFQITVDHIRFNDDAILHMTCMRGYLSLAQWLTEKFQLTADHARFGNNAALQYACFNGQLLVAQWLTTRFHLTADDARAKDNTALRYSFQYGYLSQAQWLITTFQLTSKEIEDVKSNCNP